MDDLFDDIVPTTTRARGRFAPKAKPKPPPPQKNVSAISSKDVNNVNVTSSSSTTHKESQLISPKHDSHNADIDVNNGSNKELPTNGEGSFLDSNKSLEVIDNSLEISLNAGFKSASGDIYNGISESDLHSSFEFGEVREVLSAEIELDPFSDVLPDPGTGKAKKFQPKIKPRPRVSNTPATASASASSESAVHDGTRDFPSSFGKSVAENADIFSGLESLDDILNHDATGTAKPDLKSFNVNGAEEKFVLPGYDGKSRSEIQEGADLNPDPDCPIDNVYDDYQSMKSGIDPTSEIPRHEGLTNSPDSPTLADLLQQDDTGEKELSQVANERKKSLKKHKISSIAGVEDKGGKTSRKPRKQAASKPTKNSLNEAVNGDDVLDPPYVIDGDELEENDDENDVDYSSKKTSASTSSKKKSVAKKGKTSKKRKKANDDSEKVTEEPPKKFPHASRRRKRCVDKALLENDYLDQRTIPIRDIILLAEHKERLAKKEATPSQTPSTNQSDGDFHHDVDFHHEADANYEEEFFGSDDEFRDEFRDLDDDDRATEKITSTTPLLNYQSFMDKAPRGKWSARDTEKFYEAIRQFGTDFTMIQQLFPDKTRHQIKLKYKKEERQHPLLLTDAMNNRGKDLSFFKLVVEKQKQNSNKEEDTAGDASDLMIGENEDPTPGTKEEVATAEQEQDHINVKDQEDSMAYPVPEQSDDSDDGLQNNEDAWYHYQSAI